MSSLFTSLATAGTSLNSIQRALDVVQENINNASTPGYAKQNLSLVAGPFSVVGGLPGGLRYGEVISSRDQFADQGVRQQLSDVGYSGQQVYSLGTIESMFDVTGNTGIDGALSTLLQSFSAWGTSPTAADARQGVIDAAAGVAEAFQTAAAQLTSSAADTQNRIGDSVDEINRLTTQIRGINAEILKGNRHDPGMEANLAADLESLSQVTDFTSVRQEDGTTTVMLAAGLPLVIGDKQYALASEPYTPANPTYMNAPLSIRVIDPQGTDVTSQITAGKLGGLLDFRNKTLAGLIGDSSQQGSLNTLAQTFAGRVNQILQAGQTDAGQPGIPLFTYSSDDTRVASSLQVNPAITTSTLAAVDPGPPAVANGAALSLAALNDGSTNNQINGVGFLKFYGAIAAGVGRDLSTAQSNSAANKISLTQARTFQNGISGVSLDEQAVQLMEFQRTYQAIAQTITVINQLTDTTVNMLKS